MNDYDAIIIGGGPAGTTSATLLAEKGHRVLILEKATFPRYHVGESLMPFCYFSLERLGVVEKMDEIGYQQKKSVQFATTDGRISAPFYFFQHFDHPAATTWQVEREHFDLMLLDNARSKGVEVRESTTVLDFLKDGERVVGVKARTGDEDAFEVRAPITLDCTGRDALFQRKHGWRKRDPMLNKISIWTLFKDAKRDPGLDEGATTIAYLPEGGWFWNIPLRNGIVSSGIVAERDYLYKPGETRDPAEIYARETENNAWIKDHLDPGEQFGEYWIAGEYSYRAEHCATDGLLLVGDAFAFLDPVFSSGVFLALKSGEMAADATHAALENGDTSASAFTQYGEDLCGHIETMRKIVYAFYDPEFSFGKLIRKHPDLRPKLTDLLIGNIDGKDYTDLATAIEDFAKLPEPLDYGRPVATV
ncbi:NAD(P)/FAD-dependent oxidoreductase [Haloferula rosea]|uniref:Tryptophan 7-halogenase n=1 Tax=Haloferula rosea TaxID=490093 RepID=A0A934VFP3_9BACT|nr:NAD(P)/FAD-dependent oxidoreductase [Haloferula rosea]MBK1826790.1 tryptophan 7-halogenase [Haloferula rosea]